ncbi:MAG: hypothetical protein IPN24_08165 [Betaproteobacteria bacterium]|nr:hypothetical protein [Betaproteobacteria bacterium]
MTAVLTRLSATQQRVLALLLLLLAVAALLAVVLLPVLLLHRHYDDALASMSQRLATYRRVAAQAPEYRKALDAMRERDARRFFLRNTAANLAAAELQELVRAAIESNGGRISTSQNQSPRDDGRFRQIVVTVQFFASTPNLQKILYAIETQQPYLVVDNFTLRPLNAFRGFRPAAGQEPEVNVQLEVSAYAYPEPPKGAPPAGSAQPTRTSEPPPKTADPARKPEPPRTAEPSKGGEPVRAVEPAKGAEPAKRPEPVKDAAPAKGPETPPQ